MKNEENKQEKLKQGKPKSETSGKAKLTLEAPSISVRSTVKIRIKTEKMTAQECDRLRKITNRDTRIIKDYLRIIKHNQERLLQGYSKVNKNMLHKLTITTSMKTQHKLRTTVPHDLKKRYPRCSHEELVECRNEALWIYESLITRRCHLKKDFKRSEFSERVSRKQLMDANGKRRSSRIITTTNDNVAKLELDMRDSLDTKRSGGRIHRRLVLPLVFSPYHEKKLKQGEIKYMQLVYHSKQKQWYAHFIMQISVPINKSTQPPAVLGVDLGIKKTAVAVLLTTTGKVIMDEILFIVDKEKEHKIRMLEKRIKSIQKELRTRIRDKKPTKQLNVKPDQLGRKIRSIGEQKLGYEVNQLVNFILKLKEQYNLFISVGYPKKIQTRISLKNANRNLRTMVHKWSFHKFVTKLKHKLALNGFESYRVVAIDESWTSKRCSRCNSINTSRKTQGLFNCHDCGYELNADLNGAKNIGKRLIQKALKPKQGSNCIGDLQTGKIYSISLFKSLKPLSQWLEDSSKNTSSL
jgi:IS605 OrfB family transposase